MAVMLNQENRVRSERSDFQSELRPGCPDMMFFWQILLLLGIGLISLLSASFPSALYEHQDAYYYFKRQSFFAVVGLAALLAAAFGDYHKLRRYARPLLAGAILLLILVLFPQIGVMRNHARRWLSIGGVVTFQPSELARLAIIIDFAASIAARKDRMRTWKYGVKPYFLKLMLISVLMLKEPHLSGTLLILGTGTVLLIIGGIHPKWIAGMILLAGIGVWLLLSGKISYGHSRIEMWMDPFRYAQESGYQLSQSLLAIGSGGLTGVGFGKGRQKFMYLPEEHNDFIFATVCEEMGLIGAVLIMILFMVIILHGYGIALRARDRFGSLLTAGIISLFAMQTFLNISVVTGLLPTTGVALPFFSYGGTALVLQLAEMGLVLSVSRYEKMEREKNDENERNLV